MITHNEIIASMANVLVYFIGFIHFTERSFHIS